MKGVHSRGFPLDEEEKGPKVDFSSRSNIIVFDKIRAGLVSGASRINGEYLNSVDVRAGTCRPQSLLT